MLDLSIQAWSTVWRIPAASGDVVLKQLQPRDTKEIRAHQFCADAAPRFVESPLASDLAEGRMLLRDGGPTLHELEDASPNSMAEVVVGFLAPLRRSRAVISNFEHAGAGDAHDLGPTPWAWLTASQTFGCGMLW